MENEKHGAISGMITILRLLHLTFVDYCLWWILISKIVALNAQ